MTQAPLSWMKFVLCATVFLPGFANATDLESNKNDQEILNSFFEPSSPTYLAQQKIYQQLPVKTLEEEITRLAQAYKNAVKDLDRPESSLKSLKNIAHGTFEAPEIQKQAKDAILCLALLRLAEAELNITKQNFTPPHGADDEHQL